MALGGGTFITQNKVLPGTYINFISVNSASPSLSDRGVVTMPLELDWGIEDSIFVVTPESLEKDTVKLFGYDFTHEKLKGIRDLFKNIKLLYAYRLNGGGIKASNIYATAKYCGLRGNDLKIVIKSNIDTQGHYDVMTYLDNVLLDTQTVDEASKLVSNDFVEFKSSSTLQEEAGVALTGGTNGTVNGASHQNYLDRVEAYTFNAMGVTSTDDNIKSLYVSFTKRLRDDVGAKFQTVIYNKSADYLGVVNLKNRVLKDSESSLVYYVTGLIGGCAVNKSNRNKIYNGEFEIDTNYTQNQLATCIQAGEFVLHRVGDDIRVLDDINSMVSITEEQGDVFKDNQTVRIIDQIANDIAVIFNTKYLGGIPNDSAGRVSLWSDIVKHHEELQKIRAIENFSAEDVTVIQGDTKRAVVISDAITVVNTMAKLYMTVKVS